MVDITRDKPIKVAVRVVVPVRDHPKVSKLYSLQIFLVTNPKKTQMQFPLPFLQPHLKVARKN